MLASLSLALAYFAVLPLSQAQTSNPTLELQGITAQFINSKLVPDLLPSFTPIALLTFSYNGKAIPAGTPQVVDDVKTTPTLTVTAANSTVQLPKAFTLAMVDPGAVGDATTTQTRHWLVNNVTMGAAGALNIPTEGAITQYGGPLPPDGSGPHRYVFLLYDQPSTFAPQGDLAQPGQPIAPFNVNEYAQGSGLGAVVAASYYTVEVGTATASIPSTAPVITSTLPAAQSGTTTSAGSATSTGTAKPSSSNGASRSLVEVGVAGVAAALFGVVLV